MNYPKTQELYRLAQSMRGRVEEYGDDYIETYLPKDIVEKLWEHNRITDEDGFEWSFGQVCASRDKKGIFISYANKYLGLGYHETKVYRPDSKEFEIIYQGG
jgi:hypothetical protein